MRSTVSLLHRIQQLLIPVYLKPHSNNGAAKSGSYQNMIQGYYIQGGPVVSRHHDSYQVV